METIINSEIFVNKTLIELEVKAEWSVDSNFDKTQILSIEILDENEEEITYFVETHMPESYALIQKQVVEQVELDYIEFKDQLNETETNKRESYAI